MWRPCLRLVMRSDSPFLPIHLIELTVRASCSIAITPPARSPRWRALVPGGRMAIVEPDFDAVMIDSDDLDIARAVRSRLAGSLRNPDIGRRLRRLLMDSGLELMRLDGVDSSVANLQMAVDLFHLLDHLKSAVDVGEVSVEQAAERRRWLESADAAARIFIAPVLIPAIATKLRAA